MGKGTSPSSHASSVTKIKKLNVLVDSVCGIYARVARRLGLHRSFISRVAHGERRSPPVEDALLAEYERAQKR